MCVSIRCCYSKVPDVASMTHLVIFPGAVTVFEMVCEGAYRGTELLVPALKLLDAQASADAEACCSYYLLSGALAPFNLALLPSIASGIMENLY